MYQKEQLHFKEGNMREKSGTSRPRTRRTQIAAWFLALCLVIPLTAAVTPVTAMAATQQDAVRWMNSCRGKNIYSNRGNQCVELFNQYLEKVFGRKPPSLWSAYEIYDRDYPGWTKIPASQITNYKVGDIVVYNPGNGKDVGTDGHVALVYSVGNGVKLLEQYWGTPLNVNAAVYDLHTARLKGIIRPAFDSPKPVCTHNYVISKVDSAPTETSKGRWLYKCSKCGETAAREIPSLTRSNFRNGKYRFLCKVGSQKYVSVAPGQSYVKGNIALYSKGTGGQIFNLKKKSNGAYRIGYGNEDLVLAVQGGDSTFGTNVWLQKASGAACEDWYIVPAGGGWYRLTARHTYFNMDVVNAKTEDGTNIGAWHNNGQDAQLFKPVLVCCDRHEWDAGTIEKKPSRTVTGIRKYTCKHCKSVRREKMKVFFVKYNAQGGRGSMPESIVEYGVKQKLRKNTFTRSGYIFKGWNVYNNGQKKWYCTNGKKSGWYTKGKQPSGYRLAVWKDQTSVSKTTSKDKETVTMYAVWGKAAGSVTYGNWTTKKPSAGANTTIETKTQYRYATCGKKWEKSGSGNIDYAVSWTPGFDKTSPLYTQYNRSPKKASETASEKVTVNNSKIGYIYYHWCMGKTFAHTYNRTVESFKTGSHGTFHAFYAAQDVPLTVSANARKWDNYSQCKDTWWWLDERITINRCSYTNYKKVSDGVWSSWSGWQTNKVTGSDTVKVETRTIYRTVTRN